MAYLSPEGQQDQQQQTAPGGAAPGGATPAPTQAGATPGGAKTASPNTASSVTPGSAATNVNEYLNANAPQTQQYANNVSQGLTNQYGQITSDVGNAATGFQNQVTSGYTPENTNLVNQAAANPTTFASDPTNVAAFQAQANDQYTGPNQFETSSPYTGLTNEVTAGVNAAQPWQSFSGTAGQFGNLGDTTLGEQNLDATLFAQTPGVNAQINNAATPYNTLNQYLTDTGTALDTNAANAATNAATAATNAANTINPVINNLTNDINTNTTNEQQAEEAYNAAVQGFLTPATAAELRLNQYLLPNGQSLTDRLAPIIKANQPVNTPITAANSATADQYSEAAALQELMGGNLNLPINASTSTQAGTAPTTFNSIPTLSSLVGDYGPEVTENYDLAHTLAAQNPSAGATNSIETAQNKDLSDIISYLQSIDPGISFGATNQQIADYFAKNGVADPYPNAPPPTSALPTANPIFNKVS